GREHCSSGFRGCEKKENTPLVPFAEAWRNDSSLLSLEYQPVPVSLPEQQACHGCCCSNSSLEQFSLRALVEADVRIENYHHISNPLRLHLVNHKVPLLV